MCFLMNLAKCLTFSWRRPLSYRNQSIDLQSKLVLYDKALRHERVKDIFFYKTPPANYFGKGKNMKIQIFCYRYTGNTFSNEKMGKMRLIVT